MIFGSKLKEFRERHFPGESLRKVSEKLKLGDNFYSYLSKIELGLVLPSEDFLDKILKAYDLSDKEYQELVAAYLNDKVSQSFSSMELQPREASPIIRQFLRTVNKNKDNEGKTT